MPRVSLITISYNRPLYLQEAYESLKAQTMRDWEWLVTDDGSPSSAPRDLLARLASQDPRVRYWVSEQEVHHPAHVWNQMIDQARGEYITLLDDDNKKLPEFCARMSQFLDAHQDCDAVTCYSYMQEGDVVRLHNASSGASAETERRINHVDGGELMIRKRTFDRVGWFDESFSTSEDWEWCLRALCCGCRFGSLQDPLAWYRLHPTQRLKTFPLSTQLDDAQRLQKIQYRWPVTLALLAPPEDRMTASQRQVCQGWQHALHHHPWLGDLSSTPLEADFRFLLAPFLWRPEEAAPYAPFITLHMEDPAGLPGSILITPMASHVVTNDVASRETYGFDRTTVCNALGIDETELPPWPPVGPEWQTAPHYDMGILGYPYPSRRLFVEQLHQRSPKEWSLCLIGDGWKDFAREHRDRLIRTSPTISQKDTLDLLAWSRTIICHHRQPTDVAGVFVHPCQSVHRGYLECAAGGPVLIDNSRWQHSFTTREVTFYSTVQDCVDSVESWLDHPEEALYQSRRAHQRAITDFTYRTRLERLIASFLSHRKGYCVP